MTTARPTELVWCCLPPFPRRLTGCTWPMNCRKSPSRLSGFLSPLTGFVVWGRTAQLVERRTEKHSAIPTRVRVPGVAKGYFFQSQLSVQTLLRCPYSPRVQSCTSTSVQNPNAGCHIPLSGHTNELHRQTRLH